MTGIPIRSLTIFKQGVGYFKRRGASDGQAVVLIVPRDSLNDVLKSLDITVHAGGPMESVDYETPADKTQQLANLAVQLDDRTSLSDLLISLRGSTIGAQLLDDTTITGRVVGIEAGAPGDEQQAALVLQHDDVLHCVPLRTIRLVQIQDARAAADIRFFLDISRTEQNRTTVTVRLGAGAYDLELSYSAPSPTWRISYRLAAISDGRARLTGWGIVDNTLDEDLEQVELTLVSGRPISFSYDLATTRVPPRPHVADDPTALEQSVGDRGAAEAISAVVHEIRSPLSVVQGYADLLARGMLGPLSDEQRQAVELLRQRASDVNEQLRGLFDLVRIRDADASEIPGYLYQSGPLGDLKVSASYFLPVQMENAEQQYLTYHAPAPVSVRRGQTALVPIIDAEVAYSELCVYNGAKMSNHPLRVWRLRNTSGVALEQGPVTITVAGQYQGEGMVRFTGVEDEVQVPFALEFGVLVSEERTYPPRTLRDVVFNREERRAQVAWYHRTHTRYQLLNNVRHEVHVLIEHRTAPGGAYYEMPEPDEVRAGHARWGVTVSAAGQGELVVRERQARVEYTNVANWTIATVEELRAAGGLADSPYGRLTQLLALAADDAAADAQRKAFDVEQGEIAALQDQLRKNLGALGGSEREAALRDQLLDDLTASEERRRAIAAARVTLEQTAQARETQRSETLAALYDGEPA